MRLAGPVALVALLALPAAAGGWRAINGTEVVPVANGIFEVIPHGRSGPREFWCGAGDYARTVLGVGPTQRIYIWRGIGPAQTRPGAKSVQFAFRPPPGKEDFQPGYSLSVRAEGDNLDAAMAQRYCPALFPF